MNQKSSEASSEWTEWARTRDSIKTRWVVAVLGFWITAVILAIVFYLNKNIDLILLSIALGAMVLGVVLKVRFQRHLKNEPVKGQPGGGTA